MLRSMAYHPQTNGEMERVNQELEIYFQIFCSNKPQNVETTQLPHGVQSQPKGPLHHKTDSVEKQDLDVQWEMQGTLVCAQKHLTPTSITLN